MSSKIAKPVQLRVPGTGEDPPQSRGARAVPPPAGDGVFSLAEVVLELLDYVTKHSDDTAELVDATKWKLEALLRRKVSL